MQYILICFMILIIIYSYYNYKKKKLLQELDKEQTRREEEFLQQKRQQFKTKLEELQKQNEANIQEIYKTRERISNEVNQSITDKKKQLELVDANLQATNRQLRTAQENLNNYKSSMQATIDEQLKNYELTQRRSIDLQIESQKQQQVAELEKQRAAALKQIEDDSNQKMLSAQCAYEEKQQFYNEQNQKANEALQELYTQICEYSDKQTAINQAILRQRELEEKTDFYRICIDEYSLADIKLLLDTKRNLKKPEFLDKLIYDSYVAKPVLEMIKRVLNNQTCSGIYKITCLSTKEIYIGKSTDIKSRWQQHCKTAFNCGTIASSLLHTKMKQHGIENFTFELLEEVPKDKLSEREKFYINFYKSKEVGMNERNG